jgi:hypothetical protein
MRPRKSATKEERKLRELAEREPPFTHAELTDRMNKFSLVTKDELYYSTKYFLSGRRLSELGCGL